MKAHVVLGILLLFRLLWFYFNSSAGSGSGRCLRVDLTSHSDVFPLSEFLWCGAFSWAGPMSRLGLQLASDFLLMTRIFWWRRCVVTGNVFLLDEPQLCRHLFNNSIDFIHEKSFFRLTASYIVWLLLQWPHVGGR